MKKRILAFACFVVTSLFIFSIVSCSGGSTAKGAEFVFNNGTEPQSLDPSKIEGVPEHRLYMALFEGLVSYDPKTGRPVPGVDESWSRNDAQDVITFKLRDCTWSDGEKITAQTFVDSWLYYLSPETAATYAYMPALVIKGATDYNTGKAGKETVGIRAVDDKTFEVTLVGPVPYAVDMMAHYSFSPLPMHAIQKFGADWIKPGKFVGNGPFVLESWVPQEKITLIPSKTYWNKDNVFLSRLTALPIENETTAYQKFKNGEIDKRGFYNSRTFWKYADFAILQKMCSMIEFVFRCCVLPLKMNATNFPKEVFRRAGGFSFRFPVNPNPQALRIVLCGRNILVPQEIFVGSSRNLLQQCRG